MFLSRHWLVLGAALLLSACSTSSGPSRGDAVPPPSQTPVGDAAVQSRQIDPASTTGDAKAEAPQASKEKRKSDTEACYSYASANVRNEARLDNDIGAGRGSRNSQVARYSVLTKPVNNYYYQQQQQRLFESCMQHKGYSEQ